MSEEDPDEVMSICEICAMELPIGDLFQCQDCGVEGCSACVEPRDQADGSTLCEDCDTKRNVASRKRPKRKK